jgi:hypothetical protein
MQPNVLKGIGERRAKIEPKKEEDGDHMSLTKRKDFFFLRSGCIL